MYVICFLYFLIYLSVSYAAFKNTALAMTMPLTQVFRPFAQHLVAGEWTSLASLIKAHCSFIFYIFLALFEYIYIFNLGNYKYANKCQGPS